MPQCCTLLIHFVCPRLLPLSFSSVKNMTLLSKPAPGDATTTTMTDSTQPSLPQSPASKAARTPTSPTGSTLSESEKQSTGTSQTEEAVPPMDARRAALARRRHTVFISGEERAAVISLGQPQAEEGHGMVETEDVRSDEDFVRQTRSMPHIADTAQGGPNQGTCATSTQCI